MSRELKPCPFCGGEANFEWHHDYYGVRCKNCNVEATADGMREVIEVWNTRKPMDRIVGQLEERIDFHIGLVNYEMNMGTIVDVERHKGAIKATEKAIEIVKGGAE